MSKSFSIITAAYNAEKYIHYAIESVANIQYDHSLIEHIIIDDGSTDNTQKVIKEYMKKYSHIKYYKKPNSNWGGVMNYVVENKLVHNDYVVICDGDDRIKPKAFKYVDKHCKDVNIFMGGYKMHSDKGKLKMMYCYPYYWVFRRNMFNKKQQKAIQTITCFLNATYIKKELFNSLITLKENINYQDSILFDDLFDKAKSVRWKAKILSYYWRWRKGNTMTQMLSPDAIKTIVDNFYVLASKNKAEIIYYYLLGSSQIRKYLKQNKIKFNIQDKFKIKMWPWYLKWMLYISYWFGRYKKYFNFERNK